jgi:hypothetical protein
MAFETYSGSIPEVVTLRRMVVDLGLEGTEFILSAHNYIIAAVHSRKEVKIAFSSAMKTMDRADNAIIYESKTMFCKRISFRMEDLNLDAYLYNDPERETRERMDFHRNLLQKREYIEKLHVRKDLSTAHLPLQVLT